MLLSTRSYNDPELTFATQIFNAFMDSDCFDCG